MSKTIPPFVRTEDTMPHTNTPDWLRAGAYCKNRDGDKVYVFATNVFHPFEGETFTLGWSEKTPRSTTRFTPEGKNARGPAAFRDLVGPWVEPYTPKKGDVVKLRSGRTATILATDLKGPYPVLGVVRVPPTEEEDDVIMWGAEGRIDPSGGFSHRNDIMGLADVPASKTGRPVAPNSRDVPASKTWRPVAPNSRDLKAGERVRTANGAVYAVTNPSDGGRFLWVTGDWVSGGSNGSRHHVFLDTRELTNDLYRIVEVER